MASELSFTILIYACLVWLFLGFGLVSFFLLSDFLRRMRPGKRLAAAPKPAGDPAGTCSAQRPG